MGIHGKVLRKRVTLSDFYSRTAILDGSVNDGVVVRGVREGVGERINGRFEGRKRVRKLI